MREVLCAHRYHAKRAYNLQATLTDCAMVARPHDPRRALPAACCARPPLSHVTWLGLAMVAAITAPSMVAGEPAKSELHGAGLLAAKLTIHDVALSSSFPAYGLCRSISRRICLPVRRHAGLRAYLLAPLGPVRALPGLMMQGLKVSLPSPAI